MFSGRAAFAGNIKEFLKNKKGTTAIVMAFLMPIALAGLAFGSEYGYFELSKRRLQNAADSAAFAAGTQLRSGLGQTEMEKAAETVAKVSGYDSAKGKLTLVSPPTSGAYAGDNGAVHVTLKQPVERRFSKVYDSSTLYITTDSTVLVENGRPACVLSLNPSNADAIHISGSTNVELDGCDLAANSVSTSAVSSTGNKATAKANCVTTAGGVDDSKNNYSYTECPNPIENAPITRDPYGSVPEPVCTSYKGFPNAAVIGNGNPAGTVHCYQNVNGLSKSITLASDQVYVFHNSDIKLNGGKSISGTNITIFLSGNSSITVSGNSTIDISAPTSGVYSGIALFGDRDNEIDMDLTGNSGVSIVGAIYSPNFSSDITYTGNTGSFTAGECTQVIGGGQVLFTGNSDFSTDCTNSGTTEILAAQSISVVE